MPLFGSRLAARYQAIGEYFEASDVDVVNFQEVLTYHHLRLLTKHLPSFPYAVQRPSAAGPAGGLATFSRRRVVGREFRRFPLASGARIPLRAWAGGPFKGILTTRLAEPEVRIMNTHLVANFDGDWSSQSRYYELHRQQLATLASAVGSGPVIVSGDFNVARDSSLFEDFMAAGRLGDAFGGECPPTFRSEYLRAGQVSRCIDFLLCSAGTTAAYARLILTDEVPGTGFASDHLGLAATLTVGFGG
jgi:endonuclease/exonuclease/phosphatase family metal-dependent hydrolase